MAKLIRFPLKLADGTEARSLEELREHGDVESVLKHYREGTLARWLKAFRYDELAERVAEHRNTQLEGSKANLQEVFPLLGIPLEEAAFAEYCETTLSDTFVFSDADGGDLKTYGQGVSIKDKLLPFFPTEGAEAERLKEELALWEVTETELDGGKVQVSCVSEGHSFSSTQQMEKGEALYLRIYWVLRTCMEIPKYQAIGKRGPGGGLVFHIKGPEAYEVSGVLGKHNWEEAKKVAEGYRGGGFSDWRLPTKEELNFVYQNLRKPGIITGQGDDWHWSSCSLSYNRNYLFWVQHFGGRQYKNGYDSANFDHSVRAIRSFSIDEQPLNK